MYTRYIWKVSQYVVPKAISGPGRKYDSAGDLQNQANIQLQAQWDIFLTLFVRTAAEVSIAEVVSSDCNETESSSEATHNCQVPSVLCLTDQQLILNLSIALCPLACMRGAPGAQVGKWWCYGRLWWHRRQGVVWWQRCSLCGCRIACQLQHCDHWPRFVVDVVFPHAPSLVESLASCMSYTFHRLCLMLARSPKDLIMNT